MAHRTKSAKHVPGKREIKACSPVVAYSKLKGESWDTEIRNPYLKKPQIRNSVFAKFQEKNRCCARLAKAPRFPYRWAIEEPHDERETILVVLVASTKTKPTARSRQSWKKTLQWRSLRKELALTAVSWLLKRSCNTFGRKRYHTKLCVACNETLNNAAKLGWTSEASTQTWVESETPKVHYNL